MAHSIRIDGVASVPSSITLTPQSLSNSTSGVSTGVSVRTIILPDTFFFLNYIRVYSTSDLLYNGDILLTIFNNTLRNGNSVIGRYILPIQSCQIIDTNWTSISLVNNVSSNSFMDNTKIRFNSSGHINQLITNSEEIDLGSNEFTILSATGSTHNINEFIASVAEINNINTYQNSGGLSEFYFNIQQFTDQASLDITVDLYTTIPS